MKALRLLDFDQRAGEVLRMKEHHRLAMRADLRLAVAQHTGALRLETVPRGDDVIDLVAEMMDPPSGLRSRNFAIGDASPSGSSSSILVLGKRR